MQLEAQTGGKITVEHQLNASSGLPALERYCAIGKSLREESEVKSLTKFLRDLDKQAMFCYGSIHFPFLFVEASSGIGKSQLPYALTLPTVHLFTSQLQGQQPLYSNLNPLRKIFCDALLADARVLQATVRATGKPGAPGYVGTWEDLQNCKSAFVNLQTCGLLSALVDRTLELGNPVTNPDYFRDLYGAAYTLQYTSMTPEELLQQMTSLRVEKKPLPVIFLDETPPHQRADATPLAPLARNLLRYVTLIGVMMGTNSSILNFHTHGPDSSGMAIWCFVVSRLPRPTLSSITAAGVDSTLLERLPANTRDFFKQAVLCSRPRFAEFLVTILTEGECSSTENPLDFVDTLLAMIGERMFATKTSIETDNEGRIAQLQMFFEAAYRQEHVEQNSITLPTGVIHHHLAHLRYPPSASGEAGLFPLVASRNALSYVNKWSYDNVEALFQKSNHGTKPWKPHCAFPPPEQDAMLALCLMGQRGLPAFRTSNWRRQSLAERWTEVWKITQCYPSMQSVKGKQMPVNTGEALEDLICAAVILASHCKGLGGVPFDQFLLEFCGELNEKGWIPRQWDVDSPQRYLSREACKALIPFCAPPGQLWPPALRKAAQLFGGSLGHLERPPNQKQHDCAVWVEQKDNPVITAEQKDWQEPLGPAIIAKLPIPTTTKIHMVVAWHITSNTTSTKKVTNRQNANYWLVHLGSDSQLNFKPFNEIVFPKLKNAKADVILLSLENLGFQSWR